MRLEQSHSHSRVIEVGFSLGTGVLMTNEDQNESLNTQVMREKSAVREVSLPRELANRLVSLSKADISQVILYFVRKGKSESEPKSESEREPAN